MSKQTVFYKVIAYELELNGMQSAVHATRLAILYDADSNSNNVI